MFELLFNCNSIYQVCLRSIILSFPITFPFLCFCSLTNSGGKVHVEIYSFFLKIPFIEVNALCLSKKTIKVKPNKTPPVSAS